jgi:hypothetical protein
MKISKKELAVYITKNFDLIKEIFYEKFDQRIDQLLLEDPTLDKNQAKLALELLERIFTK